MDTQGQLHRQNLPTFHILITILVSEPPSLFPGLPSCSSAVVLSAPTFVPVEPVLSTKSQESFGKLERGPLVFSGTPFQPDGKLNALPRPKDSARLAFGTHPVSLAHLDTALHLFALHQDAQVQALCFQHPLSEVFCHQIALWTPLCLLPSADQITKCSVEIVCGLSFRRLFTSYLYKDLSSYPVETHIREAARGVHTCWDRMAISQQCAVSFQLL